MYKLVLKLNRFFEFSDEEEKNHAAFGHAIVAPHGALCVSDLLYIQEWGHSRHVNYLLLFCACLTFDAILNPSAFQLFWFRQAALEHVSD